MSRRARWFSACCSTYEGNIITSIICRKAKPTYEKCFADAPRLNKTKGVGRTNIPYPASVREYGFTFTPMFDDKGQACARIRKTPFRLLDKPRHREGLNDDQIDEEGPSDDTGNSSPSHGRAAGRPSGVHGAH